MQAPGSIANDVLDVTIHPEENFGDSEEDDAWKLATYGFVFDRTATFRPHRDERTVVPESSLKSVFVAAGLFAMRSTSEAVMVAYEHYLLRWKNNILELNDNWGEGLTDEDVVAQLSYARLVPMSRVVEAPA